MPYSWHIAVLMTYCITHLSTALLLVYCITYGILFILIYLCPGRYWETVERLGITQFYGAPTALRLLLRYDESHVTKYDRSSLRVLGCGQ